ncbi:MAG: hypothetical protein JWM40_2542 [Frankiales bacterium]|nr:hypothetical protein [Frankiales bacterium]
MIKKLALATGFAAGYVLGAKAGTERYEQIMTQLNGLMNRGSEGLLNDTPMRTHGDVDLTRTSDTVNTQV